MSNPNHFKPGWHNNNGRMIVHTWAVWLSVPNDDDDRGYHLELIEVEALGTARLDTIAKKALLAAELQTWEFSHQEMQITKGDALPSGWTRRSGKHED